VDTTASGQGSSLRPPAAAGAPTEDAARLAPALTVEACTKRFGGVTALSDVSLVVGRGEVRGLLGENGSGKSTLIKILAGYHVPDSGTLHVYGQPVQLPLHARELNTLGLAFVHQDLGLIPSLTVVENLCIPMLAAPESRVRISWKRERVRARSLFREYGIELEPSARVANLRPIDRALLAIVRAVDQLHRRHGAADAEAAHGLLILDEPTVFLPKREVDQLFGLVREIAGRGGSVIFVSHDLAEVRAVTDRVTVLRDGRVIATVDTPATTEADLVEMIVGRQVPRAQIAREAPRRVPGRLAVAGLCGGPVRDLSFDVQTGEVLGLTGIAGSGFEEVPYLLFGATTADAGQLVLDGRAIELTALAPAQALVLGVALIPADRQRHGAIPGLPLTDNLALLVLPRYFGRLALRRKRMHSDVGDLLRRFSVRPDDPRAVYSALSGGNQQRALLAKWLQTRPRLLLLHEPTQGVDVGARQEIFSVIRGAAAAGTAVVCASTDHEQLAAISDRVLVFADGTVRRGLDRADLSTERITHECFAAAAISEPAIGG
jgi:ribose transport system ATP-binding protein